MHIEQFVLAYRIEQDQIRAMLPGDFESLRPVLRINTEIQKTAETTAVYIEFNTPVSGHSKNGWLNIANWSSSNTDIECLKNNKTTVIRTPFFELTYTLVGMQGGCPAEKNNDGCFYLGNGLVFKPSEVIHENKEYCDSRFAWLFSDHDACGRSTGETLPAFREDKKTAYEPIELTAQNAAAIPCQQVLGNYVVIFER